MSIEDNKLAKISL